MPIILLPVASITQVTGCEFSEAKAKFPSEKVSQKLKGIFSTGSTGIRFIPCNPTLDWDSIHKHDRAS